MRHFLSKRENARLAYPYRRLCSYALSRMLFPLGKHLNLRPFILPLALTISGLQLHLHGGLYANSCTMDRLLDWYVPLTKAALAPKIGHWNWSKHFFRRCLCIQLHDLCHSLPHLLLLYEWTWMRNELHIAIDLQLGVVSRQ